VILKLEETHMRKPIISAVCALPFVATLAWAQGAGQPQNPSGQKPTATTETTVKPITTLVGCLYREDQIPGRKPNIAERAGILEDYILADAATATTPPNSSTGVTGTSGSPTTGNMYKVEGPSDERLKALVGKQVEVTGRIDPEGGPAATPGTPRPDRGLGPDQLNLPEFEASSIREVSGKCPATPAVRK
jgi:hypothetical protein